MTVSPSAHDFPSIGDAARPSRFRFLLPLGFSLLAACGSAVASPRAVQRAGQNGSNRVATQDVREATCDSDRIAIGPAADSYVDPPRARSDDTAAVQRVCASIAQDVDVTIRDMEARSPRAGRFPREVIAHLDHCVGAEHGAWIVVSSDLRGHASRGRRNWQVDGAWSLVYIAPDGHAVSSENVRGEISIRSESQRSAYVAGTFDFDGDGVAEVILERNDGDGAGSQRELYTMRGDTVRRYPHEGFPIIEPRDVDDDGRPDWIGPSEFTVTTPDDFRYAGPRQLAHTRSDGRFSFDDDVARAFARHECASHDLEHVVAIDAEPPVNAANETVFRIGCARLHGVPTSALETRLREAYVHFGPTELEHFGLPLESALTFARATARFTLRPLCPPPHAP